MKLNAKCSDATFVEVPHLGLEKEGYMPRVAGLGGGDYINLTVCLDCGQLQGFDKVDDEDLRDALE